MMYITLLVLRENVPSVGNAVVLWGLDMNFLFL